MIALNLLPDVKKEYLKSQRTKRLFIALAVLVSAASIGIVTLMGTFVLGQRVHLGNVQEEIDNNIQKIAEENNIDKVLTIQKQLEQLDNLHDSKYATLQLFDYVKVLVPNNLSLSSLELDNRNTSVLIKGFGDDYQTVNKFADTLKNAEFSYEKDEEKGSLNPFSAVTLGSISPDNEEQIVFTIRFTFDPLIFDNTLQQVSMTVPSITSSPSVTERPGSLFEQLEETEGDN